MDGDALSQLEKRISELKALYDNYFAGIERREPLNRREQLERELRRLQIEGKGTTQLQFRLSNLRARFQTLEAHWNRIVKQIEEGTFHKARARPAERPAEQPTQAPVEPVAAAEAAPKVAAPLPPPKAAADPMPTDAAMRALYKTYADARAKTGEAAISYDAMVASLKKQVPQVVERFKCKSVEFKVGQKDGKTIIKAVPIP